MVVPLGDSAWPMCDLVSDSSPSRQLLGVESAPCTLPSELRIQCCKSDCLVWSKHLQPHFLFYSTVFLVLTGPSMSTTVSTEGLPLDNRSNDLKIPIITLIIFSSIFVALRLYISWRNRNFFQLTDHFLWTGHVSVSYSTAHDCRTR